jgi:prepilin-type N-terminal cleavage/methylation domain-containing protein
VRHPGYTLIELLAVVVVLGLAAGIGIPPLVRLAGGTPLERACALLRDGDARARMLARGTGRELAFELDAGGMRCRAAREPLEALLPEGVSAEWLATDGQPLRTLTIDSRGRSRDLSLRLRAVGASRRFHLLGLSGEWDEEPATP